jgi:hypothetical protein
MSNGTYYDLLDFFDKISPFFHPNDPDPHQKSPKNTKYFANSVQKNIKIARLKNTPPRQPADFDVFWTEFAKYFVFWGIFDVISGSF